MKKKRYHWKLCIGNDFYPFSNILVSFCLYCDCFWLPVNLSRYLVCNTSQVCKSSAILYRELLIEKLLNILLLKLFLFILYK